MKSISNKSQKAVRSNVQELDSFFWLLKLHYIVCKLFETMSMIRNDDDSLFHLLRNHHLGSVEKVGVEPHPKRVGPAS